LPVTGATITVRPSLGFSVRAEADELPVSGAATSAMTTATLQRPKWS
jgi:hypothetical protein